MRTSPNGIKFIAEHEGEILHVYADPVGLPTLGVGHLLTESEKRAMPVGTKITKEQSREYLAKDLARFERAITANVQVPVTQNQFDALVAFAFNIGESAFKRSSTLRKLNNKDYAGAADAMLAWNKARNKKGVMVALPGLTRRRKEERALFLTPDSAAAPNSKPSDEIPDNGVVPAIQPSDPQLIETKITEETVTGGSTVTASVITPAGDPPEAPPTQVSTNGPLAKWIAGGGGLTAIGTFVWGYIQSNPSAVGIAVVCLTLLIIAIIFRGAITDAIRMQTASDPSKKNVS